MPRLRHSCQAHYRTQRVSEYMQCWQHGSGAGLYVHDPTHTSRFEWQRILSPCIKRHVAPACTRSSQPYPAMMQHTPCVCSISAAHTSWSALRGPSSVAALVAELGAQATALQQQPEIPPGGEVVPSGLPQGEPSLPRFPSGIPQVSLQQALSTAGGYICPCASCWAMGEACLG